MAGLPSTDNALLTATVRGEQAILSWALPRGEYDQAVIRQCFVGTDQCFDHAVPSVDDTSITVQHDPNVEVSYTLLLYQHNETVFTSADFHIVNDGKSIKL